MTLASLEDFKDIIEIGDFDGVIHYYSIHYFCKYCNEHLAEIIGWPWCGCYNFVAAKIDPQAAKSYKSSAYSESEARYGAELLINHLKTHHPFEWMLLNGGDNNG